VDHIHKESGSSVRLLQMYNPWGLRRWRGKWNNYDVKTWTEHPEIATVCGFEILVNDDGAEISSEGPDTFWISFEDFLRWFDELHSVWTPPSNGWHSIKYEVLHSFGLIIVLLVIKQILNNQVLYGSCFIRVNGNVIVIVQGLVDTLEAISLILILSMVSSHLSISMIHLMFQLYVFLFIICTNNPTVVAILLKEMNNNV